MNVHREEYELKQTDNISQVLPLSKKRVSTVSHRLICLSGHLERPPSNHLSLLHLTVASRHHLLKALSPRPATTLYLPNPAVHAAKRPHSVWPEKARPSCSDGPYFPGPNFPYR